MNSRIGIVGASGNVGEEFYNLLKRKNKNPLGTYFSKKIPGLVKFDICNKNFSMFNGCGAVVILSGTTNIDECRRHKDEAYEINVAGTIALIRYLSDKKIKMIFISSDQVFDGKMGNYNEEDEPNPINLYGEFKLDVERFMAKHFDDYLILRLSKIYSRNSSWGIYAETLGKLKKGEKVKAAYNMVCNPTEVGFVCEAIYKAIKADLKSLYHIADSKVMSRYDFAISIANEFGFDKKLIEPIDMNKLPLLEKRALNSSLDVKKAFDALDLNKVQAWQAE